MTVLDALFFSFLLIVFIQIIYYGLIFSRFAFDSHKAPRHKRIAISVIICCKNEADNLRQNLPLILEQDHPDFEVILINDASTDDTLKVMEEFALKNHNIKIVDVKSIEAFWGNKKYALTLGIKVASHDFLLFTDADCKPLSNSWIREMGRYFSNTKSIVIGYSPYKKKPYSLLNKLIRYETLLTAVQYFSYAKIGIPYMAVGRNLSYRKDEFFKANGFMDHMRIRSGDDDLFVNQVANSTNTALCFSQKSFTETAPESSFKKWINQKRRHYSTASYYKSKHQVLLGLFYISQLLFWVLAVVLISFLYYWKIVLGLILIRLITQYLSIGFSSQKLNETDILLLLPFLEIFLILSQFFIFILNLTSKPSHWR
jgi:glycosyltransferase involved in cell wall biosynthesis